jgi:hypothetical protein
MSDEKEQEKPLVPTIVPEGDKPLDEAMRLPPQLYDFTVLVAGTATDALPTTGPMGYYGLIRPTGQLIRDALQRKNGKQLMNGSLILGAIALSLFMVANPGYVAGLKQFKEDQMRRNNGSKAET